MALPLLQSATAFGQQATAPRRPVALPAWFIELDAAKAGFVTREQFIAHRLKDFDKLDTDKDGVLSRLEFVKLSEPPFAPPPVTPAAAARARALYDTQFSSIDTNDDGKMSRAEFQVSVALSFRELDLDGDGRATREEVLLLERMAEDARETARKEHCRTNPDCNGDGAVDLQEFVTYETERMLERLDADKDGKITLQTFLVFAGPNTNLAGQPPYEQRREQVTRRFNEIDANKNGVIDADEIRAWAAATFKRLDLDGDGRINPSEWQLASQSSGQPQTAAPPTTPVKPQTATPTTQKAPPPKPNPKPVAPPPPPPPQGLQPGAPLR